MSPRPQPDSRIACAIVTDAGTLYSRKLCRAGPATMVMNAVCSAVRPAIGAGTGGSTRPSVTRELQRFGVPVTLVRYECDTYRPSPMRSHSVVAPPGPLTFAPTSWQRIVTCCPPERLPTDGDVVDGPLRTFTHCRAPAPT